MTSEGKVTKRTRKAASAIPMEEPSKRHRRGHRFSSVSSGKFLWTKLVKEHHAAQASHTSLTQAEVYKCILVFCHRHTMRTSGRREGRLCN